MTALAINPGQLVVQVRQPGGVEPQAASPGNYLTLPNPPSVNKMYADGPSRRVKSAAYKDWLLEAGWRLRAQNPKPHKGQVLMVIGAERHSEAADIDNRVKALFDLLVAHEVIADDRHVTGFAIAWLPPSNGLVHVAIMDVQPITIQFHPANSPAHGGWFIAPTQPEEPENNGL
jgi:Holliday junction resolvase RusA-like endonuclease